MKFFFWTLVLVSALLFVSPVYSLYKIGMGIKEKDKEVLNENFYKEERAIDLHGYTLEYANIEI